MKKRPEVVLVLNDLRSAHNVGSIFRTADAAGVSKLFLVGYTPTPTDQFGRINKEIMKTALGGEKSVSWEKLEDFFSLIKKLKKESFTIVALEQDSKSVDYKKFKSPGKIALVVGREVEGLSKKELTKADVIIEIPMRGKKESLNVSVATGIALFRILDI